MDEIIRSESSCIALFFRFLLCSGRISASPPCSAAVLTLTIVSHYSFRRTAGGAADPADNHHDTSCAVGAIHGLFVVVGLGGRGVRFGLFFLLLKGQPPLCPA